MRETVKDPGRIAHMYEAAVILRDKCHNITLESIKENQILFFGLVKLIEIIGEAAYKLTVDFKDSHRDLPWDAIIGMRHVMVHGYYTISPEKIWATVISDIPDMIPILEKYLKDLK
ncbi:MAG: DUF86 domain-containing protein [Bacteroidales bacterium]|nr:DUF86 domain-containing protein [Bacteroidales bacterium]